MCCNGSKAVKSIEVNNLIIQGALKEMKKLSDYIYYEEPAGVIYCGDCLKILPLLSPVDLVLTDPPYELDTTSPSYNSKIMSLGKYHSKEYKELCSGYDRAGFYRAIIKLCNPLNMFMFCSNKQLLKTLSQWDKYNTTVLVWHKNNAPPFANGVWANDIEYIVHIREKGAVFQGGSLLKRKVKTHPIVIGSHPTEKPMVILSQFLQIGSNPADLILDPFLGSGTTALAAKQLGRKFIGIEISETYCKIARDRLMQEELFQIFQQSDDRDSKQHIDSQANLDLRDKGAKG